METKTFPTSQTTSTRRSIWNSLPTQIFTRPSRVTKNRQISILVAAFMLNFTACGLLFAFGVYQALYETMSTTMVAPFSAASIAQIGLIGGLATGLMKVGAPLTVAWTKNFGPRPVVFVGGILFGLGSILASFGTSIWHFELSQGILLGVGSCLSFMPSMTVTPTWFSANRGLAMGIVSAGTGIGGLIWAPVATACIQNVGFRNSLRITGAASTMIICSASIFLHEPPETRYVRQQNGKPRLVDLWKIPLPPWNLFTQPRFVAAFIGGALQNAAYYTPVFYLATFAETLDCSATQGANLIALSNACNAVGKITVGFLADRLGRLNSLFITTLISAAACFSLWIPSAMIGLSHISTSRGLLIGNTIMYGFFASAYQSLFPATMVDMFSGQSLTSINGPMYMVQGAAGMIGTPIAGLLVNAHGTGTGPERYTKMAILVGALLTGASGMSAWATWLLRRSHADEGQV